MVNSWSLLYDEMSYSKKSLKNEILQMNSSNAQDTLEQSTETENSSELDFGIDVNDAYFTDSAPESDVEKSASESTDEDKFSKIDLNLQSTSNNRFWKYEEDLTLKEIREYLSGTYKAHYTSSESKTQTLDLIEGIGDAEPFCRSNAIKYLSRFGKKNGKSKLDILKAIHYCILLYHFSGIHKQPTGNYETF
jgi:hypothetical protein